MNRKLAAEFLGTFWLTFGGCGAAVLAAGFPQLGIGFLGVALAFGLTVTGSTLRPRPVAFKGEIARNLEQKVWPLIEAGRIKPVVYKTFPLAQASEAHKLMESSQHIGKIVLEV